MLYNLNNKQTQTTSTQSYQQIKQLIQDFTQRKTYHQLCHQYKIICARLSYFFISLRANYNQKLQKCLYEILEMVNVMAQATDFLKFGHRLPLLLYLIRKYQNIKHEKFSAAPNEKIVGRLELNQQDEMFTSSPLTPIESEELVFLASSDLQPFLSGVVRNEVYLQNSTSVCCSRVFVKGQAIIHNDPALLKVVTLGAQKGFDETILTRYLNALCNSNGGVLLIGATRSGDVIRVSGVRFKSEQEVTEKQKVILSSLSSLSPACQYRIDKVHVHTNYLEANPKVPGEYRRFCFRIMVWPQSHLKNRATYGQVYIKGYQSIYDIYEFDNKIQPLKIQNRQQNQEYRFLHLIYKRSNDYQFPKRIFESAPIQNYSKLFMNFIQQGIMTFQDIDNLYSSQNYDDQSSNIALDEPKFKYSNVSLATVVSKKNQRHALDFYTALKQNKQSAQLSKAYQNSFKDCSRSIFILSHQVNFDQLKKLLIKYQNQHLVKPDAVTLIPVTTVLQVYNQRLSQYILKSVRKKFEQRFNKELEMQQAETQDKKSGGIKPATYFIMSNISEAIYAYMIFQELQIRPFFAKLTKKAQGCM